ncbi:MAG: YycH protein, partial [Clostridiales bacterium]|nr:YycH protein [Clostridiales bacterium]
KYNDFLIFNNSVEAIVSKLGIHSLDYKFKKISKNGFAKDTEKVLPSYQILLKNFISSNKMVITNIDLGFSSGKVTQDTKGLLESPVWRIKTEGSSTPLEFNAYTGAALK